MGHQADSALLPKSNPSRHAPIRQHRDVVVFLFGACLASCVTLALAAVVLDLAAFSLTAAYVLLGVLLLIMIGALIYQASKRRLVRSILGVDFRDLGEILGDASDDVREGRYYNLLSGRGRELCAVWFDVKVRHMLLTVSFLILGELVLLITAALIVKQTGAIEAQTQVAREQRDLLSRQNEIQSLGGRYEEFYQLHTATNDEDRAMHFRRLVLLGHVHFAGLICNDLICDGISLSGGSLRGTLLPKLRFRAVALDRLDFREATVEYGQFINLSMRSADLSESELAETLFDNVVFSDATLRGTVLVGSTFRNCTFDGTDFMGADLTLATFEDTSPSPAQLASCSSMKGVFGIGTDTLAKVRELAPASVESEGMRFVVDAARTIDHSEKPIPLGTYRGQCPVLADGQVSIEMENNRTLVNGLPWSVGGVALVGDRGMQIVDHLATSTLEIIELKSIEGDENRVYVEFTCHDLPLDLDVQLRISYWKEKQWSPATCELTMQD